MWDKKNNQSISSGDGSVNLLAGRDINLFNAAFPTELVDQEIEEKIGNLRRSSFFSEFDRVNSTLFLGRQIAEGVLSGGVDAVRGAALAWCARLLSLTDELDKAEEYLKLAKSLGPYPEIEIADAFIASKKGSKSAALKILAVIKSSASCAAALMIVAHHDGGEQAIDWLKDAGIEATALDAEGKYFYLAKQLELGKWEDARKTLEALNNNDFEEAPVLHHMFAITLLLSTIPTEYRAVVLNQLPFEAASFPLASDTVAIEARRTARRHFTEGSEIAKKLNCPVAAGIDEEYALWIELRDPDNSEKGRQRLENKLRDPKPNLRLVPLGLKFGLKLDLAVVEQEIEKQIALHGGITQDAAIARFALTFTQNTPEDAANYIARHFIELSKYHNKKSMQSLQIELLSQAGLPERANECLTMLKEEGLSEVEESRLRRRIAEAKGSDPVEGRRVQFKKTDSLDDLVILVEALESKGDWESLCVYGEMLFRRTTAIHDADRLAKAFSNTQKSKQLVELIEDYPDLIEQSKSLQTLYCWSLYDEGKFLEARSELAKLSNDLENSNYRALQVNLGISIGDWNSLSTFVEKEYLENEKRSAHDLIGAAQLALHLDLPRAKDLIFAAVAKGNDAAVLAAAYFMASSAGWEGDAEVIQWLHKAAELSGDNGPIQKMNLKDVLDRKPEWDRRESETWQLLSRGEIPMFVAARSLNKSLIDLMLFPAHANLLEIDPRRRSAVPAYSGKRQPARLDTIRATVGVDATTLLTLSFLNLLDMALDVFNVVYIPHSTLTWLFEEKQKATFHQRSRIRDANLVRDFLARDILEKFVPSTVADSDLSAQVGDELAVLIAEAEKVRDEDDTQRVVVRSSAVHRLSSLMEEEADLTGHAVFISSCMSIVEKLREKGQITAKEEKRARAYFQLREKTWPNQPEIIDGAVLYLDDLAITYFLHLGILGKLRDAGFRPIASPRAVSEANALIMYERIADKVKEDIESIRSTVSSRIECGKIKVGRRLKADEQEGQSIFEHPTMGIIALASDCDAVISDDRLLNQHAHVDDGNAKSKIFTTLDLLDALAFVGTVSTNDLLEYRTRLRRAGYFFVPVSDDELAGHLNASSIKNDEVIETAELKAIRENILRVRMTDWLQLPKEVPWLDITFKVFIRVLRGLWKDGIDLPSVTARSNWIVGQVDVRGWAHRLGPENGDNVVRIGRGAYILMLLMPLSDVPQVIEDEYWNWIEGRILAPIKDQYPELYARIVEWQRIQIAEIAKGEFMEGEAI